ncbi:TPA: hypothetical protein DCW38_03410 [candidate division WOR-3 bacterium]|uniref:Transcriptional regulator HTH-type FeoC domain-containing protein n=1 Tax=candidate division WOR-3 bacterium TaxID=2052148 RepID=A0A350H9J4_UNCW3|nr:hypothetical protein [candidate division WOR-3 bacterium]
MFEEIIEYIKINKMVSLSEVMRKFKIDREMIIHILKYAEKTHHIKIRIDKNEKITCSSCPMRKK